MELNPNSCDRSRLHLSLEDRLSETEQIDLEDHLESCPNCRQELERMAAASRLWGDAQRLRGETAQFEAGVGAGANAHHALDNSGDPLDTVGDEGGWVHFLDPPDGERPEVLGKLGPYEVIEFLGRGGMGLVLKARDPALDRMVAIKVLTPALAHGANARRRFAREARAVAAVGNEHIVAIHAVDEFRGMPYLVMQYVPGRSLQDRLDASGPLEIKDILRIGTQAARALAAAHAQGVVHRDIKPANILLENCIERVKLTDFGLARAIDDASVTQSGVIAGTPQYMAPEQARGEPVAARADLFSLGAVLYAMAAGRPPFRGDSAMAVLKRVCEIPHRSVRELNPDVPDWLEAVIDRLLAKDPSDRFESAAEVADLLEKGLAHLQQPATVSPPVVPAVNRHSTQLPSFEPAVAQSVARPRRKLALVASLLLLIGAGFGASEAAGFTQVGDFVATILRIKTGEGTLAIKCGDPSVKVQLDGKDLVIAGTGFQEIRLKSGTHRLAVTKDGRPVREEIVSVARGGKEIVNVSLEPNDPARLGERKPLPDLSTPRSHEIQCMSCHSNLEPRDRCTKDPDLGYFLPTKCISCHSNLEPRDRCTKDPDLAYFLPTKHAAPVAPLAWRPPFGEPARRCGDCHAARVQKGPSCAPSGPA
jgi:serine/threonine protein kinase